MFRIHKFILSSLDKTFSLKGHIMPVIPIGNDRRLQFGVHIEGMANDNMINSDLKRSKFYPESVLKNSKTW